MCSALIVCAFKFFKKNNTRINEGWEYIRYECHRTYEAYRRFIDGSTHVSQIIN